MICDSNSHIGDKESRIAGLETFSFSLVWTNRWYHKLEVQGLSGLRLLLGGSRSTTSALWQWHFMSIWPNLYPTKWTDGQMYKANLGVGFTASQIIPLIWITWKIHVLSCFRKMYFEFDNFTAAMIHIPQLQDQRNAEMPKSTPPSFVRTSKRESLVLEFHALCRRVCGRFEL